MDKQRIDAYINLIEQLLWCTSGEEMVILQQQPKLLDAGLLEVMALEAEQLQRRRNGKAAQRLLELAGLVE
ncbi:hypothetical protein [Calothrix sp. NIES-2098]|uniref:hypothetical protein n=1 Tax=Calothrix sp. NIES-2098 TaxID=1954171 RepID=UPI000B6212C1|nr:hypothetical protein NIES2098_40440 [Calothrix sp. NIES-2098]